jgi:hypothetical protein
MKQGELRHVLEAVIAVLDSLGISYHVTGGLASSFYGEPRLTQDIDFVVRVASSEIARLPALLDREFLLDPERARRARSRERGWEEADSPLDVQVRGASARATPRPVFPCARARQRS